MGGTFSSPNSPTHSIDPSYFPTPKNPNSLLLCFPNLVRADWAGSGPRYTEQESRESLQEPGAPFPECSGSLRQVWLPGSKGLAGFARFPVSVPGNC